MSKEKEHNRRAIWDNLPTEVDLAGIIRISGFIALLILPYIYNAHRAERNVRKLDELNRDIKDLRAEYITLKSEHMSASKQSDVAERLAPFGLVEPETPPLRLKEKP